MFRYEDDVRLAGHAGPQCQMSRVASHHFDNLHPAVRTRGRAGPFDYFGDISQCGVKTKRIVGAGNVLVDCLRNSNYPHTGQSEPRRHAQGVLSSADNDRIKAELFNVLYHFGGAILKGTLSIWLPERIGPRRAKVGSAIAIPPSHSLTV